MKSSNGLIIVFALLLSTSSASAQVTLVSEDPNPETDGCQNIEAAFHQNGDVVMVDYHGQWLEHDNGRRTQNGGHKYQGCEVERVYRMSQAGEVVWQIRPTHDASDHGFARQDRISGLAAMPDGSTVITAAENVSDDHMHVSVMMVDKNGARKWHTKTSAAPKYVQGLPHVSSSGEVFVSYSFTNYGYSGGQFRLGDGKRYALRENQMRNVFARIDPTSGAVIWQKEMREIVSVEAGEVLYLESRYQRGERDRSRYQVRRMTYDGKPISSAWTPWLENEEFRSAQRFEGKLAMSTTVTLREGGRVKERFGRLRIFDFKGRLVSTREISDSTILAARGTGCALHLVSPSECDRSLNDRGYCRTRGLDVLTLKTLEDPGKTTRIRVPRGHYDSSKIAATSTRDGLWVSALTYYGREKAPAVTLMRTRDDARPEVNPKRFVWTPKPREKKRQEVRLGF